MATKKPTFSDADLAVAEHMLQTLQNKLRGLNEVEKLIRLVSNRSQVISERKRTLAALDAEIKERENATIKAAEEAGERKAAEIVARARKQAEDILADVSAKRDVLTADINAKQAEFNSLQERIDAAKDEVRRVLSAA